MPDSWLALRPRQLSRDDNLELIYGFVNTTLEIFENAIINGHCGCVWEKLGQGNQIIMA